MRVGSLRRQAGGEPVGLAPDVVVDVRHAEALEPPRGPGAHVSERVPAVDDHRPPPVEPARLLRPQRLQRQVDRSGKVLLVVLVGGQDLGQLGADGEEALDLGPPDVAGTTTAIARP